MSDIGKKIRAIRQIRNVSQLDVSRRAFISYRTYQRIEKGLTIPNIQQLENISTALGCAVHDILNFNLENNCFGKVYLERENALLKSEIVYLRGILDKLSTILPDGKI